MGSDRVALLCLGIAVVVLVGTALARRTGLPDPVVLVTVGLAASFLPGAPDLQLPPDVVFLVFLPPLLYRASFLTSPQTLREHATPIALLSVGLVGTTALGVAWVVSALVPGIGFAEGLVLGAVVAPTDPVAAANVFQRLGAPRRVVDLVESESLVNDATALVLYAVAVEAVVGDPPTLTGTVLQLSWAVVGGVGIGLAVGGLVQLARRRITDVGLQLLLSLVTPYAAYVVTDRLHSSGVLAVVTAGVLLGGGNGPVGGPEVRLQSAAFWSLLDLLLNAVLFVLLGLQVRAVVQEAPDVGLPSLLLYGAVVVAVVTGLRVAWQFVIPPVVYRVRTLTGREQARSSLLERLLIGWTGMRGAISLAAALALPLQVEGRSLLVFLTVVVVLVTLVLQSLTLPWLLRHADLEGEAKAAAESEREARLAMAEVALSRLDELEQQGSLPAGGGAPLRQVWEDARDRLTHDTASPEVDLAELRLDIAQMQGAELDRRRKGLPPQVARELQQELDLQHVRLAGRDDEDRRAPVT